MVAAPSPFKLPISKTYIDTMDSVSSYPAVGCAYSANVIGIKHILNMSNLHSFFHQTYTFMPT